MRFELETISLTIDDAFTLDEAAQVVAWRYKLAVRETGIYFDALDGFRRPQ